MLPVDHERSRFWSFDVLFFSPGFLETGLGRVQTMSRLIRENLRNAHFSGLVDDVKLSPTSIIFRRNLSSIVGFYLQWRSRGK